MNKCIEWTGTIDANGYGVKWSKEKRNWIRAHRWVYEQQVGPIPNGFMIRHLCHNKRCVNIDHLAVGTMKDNRQDDIVAGKLWFVGENNCKAKLTEQQVLEIRSLQGHLKYGDIKLICEYYKITKHTVYDIWKRRLWKHI